jgi:adenylosuccinate synthase
MKRLIAVIGAGWGDEGKGVTTDYFADQLKTGYVVRFNSGAQAAHTVQLDNDTRHVFSHFGSGTFVGLSTVLGEHFVVNPLLFQKEREELLALGYNPKTYVHENCMVTTPYDMIVNQLLETLRGDNRHGSCGVGFNETIERHENYPTLTTRVYEISDILVGWSFLIQQLECIRSEWLRTRTSITKESLSDPIIASLVEAYNSTKLFNDYIKSWDYFVENVEIIPNYNLLNNDNVIFEGAQGLQLDQNSGNFPYVTRSNTGIKNVLEIVDQLDNPKKLEVVYVSRCYSTKHGAGPLPFEQDFPEHLDNVDKTNKPNEFQGTLRYAPLNLDDYVLLTMTDISQCEGVDYMVQVLTAFTCLDQNPTQLISKGVIHDFTIDQFNENIIGMANIISYGPTRSTIQVI